MRSTQLVALVTIACLLTAAVPGEPTTGPAETGEGATLPTTSAPATAPAAASEPATEPAATEPVTTVTPTTATATGTPTTAPAPVPTKRPPAKKWTMRFQFEGTPYTEIVRRFSDKVGKPLIGDIDIEGELTFQDFEEYDYDQALDMLNMFLAMRGYQLIEFKERFLSLVPVGDIATVIERFYTNPDAIKDVRPGKVVTVVLSLKYLDAETAAKTVVRMVSGYGSIAPLPRGKGIILTDRAENIQRIRGMLAVLDQQDLVDKKIRTIKLQSASARSVANNINNLLSPDKGEYFYNSRIKKWVPGADPSNSVTATFDEQTNVIFLRGAGDRLAMAEELIKQFDDPESPYGPTGSDVKIIELKNARAEDVAKTVNAILPSGPVKIVNKKPVRTAGAAKVVADTTTNTVIVTAPPNQMPGIEKLIAELDELAVDAGGMRIRKLKFADAQQMVSIVLNALSQRGPGGRRVTTGFTVAADQRTNSLILVGPEADIERAEKLIEQFDVEQPTARQIQVVQLAPNQDARSIARSLVTIFATRTGGRGGSTSGLRVEADSGTNSLIISAPPGDWPIVKKLLDELGENAEELAAPITKLVPLEFAGAEELSNTLRQIYSSRQKQRGQAPVLISASMRGNSLLISATEGEHAAIAELIKTLDVDEPAEPLRMIELTAADPESVVEKIRGMLDRTRDRDVYIQADPLTGTVLLRAPAAKRKMIEDIIAKIDEAYTVVKRLTRTIVLEKASARQVAATLTQLYEKYISSGGRYRGPQVAPAEQITITPAPDDRTIIVDGPESKVEEIAALAASIDSRTLSTEMSVRTFALKNAKAVDVRNNLNRLFYSLRKQGVPSPRFEYDSSANHLIVAATDEQFVQVEEIIEKLEDAIGESMLTKTFTLQYAKADELAPFLQQLLSESTQYSRGDTSVQVAVISSANTIMVKGSKEKVTRAEEFIKEFDTKEKAGASVVRIIKLKHAQAETLANTLRAMIPRPYRGQAEVYVQADALTNSVLIRAPEAQRKMVEDMVLKLDVATIDVAREQRIVPIEKASARAVAGTLSQIYWQEMSTKRRTLGQAAVDLERIVVTAAPNDKSIIIDAPLKKIEEIAALAKQLDEGSEKMEIRTYTIAKGDVRQFARSLSNLHRASQPQPRFEADVASGQLMVSAAPHQFEEIEKAIKDVLDNIGLGDVAKVYMLKHANAADMVDLIKEVLGGGAQPSWYRGGTQDEGQLVVATLPSGNAIVMKGPPNQLDVAEKLLEDFDKPELSSKLQIQRVKLKNADARTLAQAVNSALREGSSNWWNPSTATDQVQVTAETNSNSLLVRGPAEQVPEVIEMIKSLDAESEPSDVIVKVYRLENSNAEDLVDSLGSMFRDLLRQQRGSQPAPPFSIAADPRTNSLVVSTTEAHHALVEHLKQQLDQTGEGTKAHIVSLEHADARRVETQLSALFYDRDWDDRPTIEVDNYSNALTVIAKDADWKAMEEVLAQLDVPQPTVVRVIPITDMPAEKMADLIQRLYGAMTESRIVVINKTPKEPEEGASEPSLAPDPSLFETESEESPATQPATSQPFASEGDETAAGAEAKERDTITIGVDTKAKALIISGTQREIDNIETLISDLEFGIWMEEPKPRMVKVENADPAMVAQTLDALFNPRYSMGTDRNGRPLPPPPPTINVVPNPSTRSVIIFGKPLDLDRAEEMVKQLDKVPQVVSEVRVIPLTNTDANEVAANVRDIFRRATSSGASRTSSRSRRPTPTDQRAEMVRQVIEMLGKDGVTRSVDTATAVSVTANEQSNSVVVVAPVDAMELIVSLVEELDQSAVAKLPSVRLYPLKNAEVSTTVTELREIYSGARRPGRAGEAPVVITGDEAGKVIIVSALPEKQELIAKVIGEIDRRQEGESVFVKVYPIEHVEARTMAPALLSAMSTSPQRGASPASLRIQADTGSNTLVIRATREDHEEIAGHIKQMDISPAEKYPVQTITLKNADARSLAQMLMTLFTQPQARGGRRGGSPVTPAVIIQGDSASGQLLVRSDPETFKRIQALALQMDATTYGKSTRRVMALAYADAASIAPALQQAFAPVRGQSVSLDDLVNVVAETYTNSIIVTANEKNMQRVEGLLKELDREDGGRKTEFMLLANARAAEVADVLSKIATPSGGRPGAGQQVVVSPHTESNAIVITGPDREVAKLMQIAKQLDAAGIPDGTGVYILALETGDAVEVTKQIQSMYNQQVQIWRQNRQTIEPLAVSADERANAVVLATSKKMYAQVSDWVTQLENMKPSRGQLRFIPIKYADPEDVKKAIDELFDGASAVPSRSGKGNPGGSSVTGKVDATVLEKQRSLMISASDEDYEAIRKLIEEMEEAARAKKGKVEIFTLEYASSVRVAAALNGMYSRAREPEEQVTVTALQQTNAVLVRAAAEKMEEVGRIIAQLDTQKIEPPVEFRIYTLKNATPSKILPTLRNMLRNIPQVRPGETIDVQADERTRSIIVTARGTMFDQVGKIIETLDKAPPPGVGEAQVLIVRLKRNDAQRLAQVLNEMLRPSASGQVTPEARALQEQIRRLRVRSTLKEDIPELDLSKPIKITADPVDRGSNSLLVSSTPENLKAMAAIIEVLDTVPVDEATGVRLVHLKNSDALSVMQILREIFTQGRQLAGRPGTSAEGRAEPESLAGKALVHPFNVSADLRTNTLVLSGIEESVALAELIIRDLDRVNGRITTEIRLFRLKHAQAARLLPVLSAVFTEGAPTAGSEGLRTQVTRLRTVLSKDEDKGSTSQFPKTRAALTVQADETTNILVVAARSDIMPLIEDVINTMDVPGAGSLTAVRIFPLINADATRLSQVVSSLYAGPNAQFVRDEDKPTVAVDTRTNALVISASDKTFALIETLLNRLDAKSDIEFRDIRLLPLTNAEAATLAPVLQQMMDNRVQRQAALGVRDAEALRTVIIADARSNYLIIGGSPESFQLVKDLAERLDGASPALGGQIQLIPLTEANAGTLSATLTRLFNERYQAARTADVQRQRPIILPDLRVNALLVAANADDTKVLRSLLEKLDVKITDPAVRLVVIALKHNDAGIIGPTIQQIFQARLQSMTPPGVTPTPQDRVDVATDALANALIISASKENLALIDELLKKVDVEPPVKTGVVRLYPLINADAQRVATMLQSLLSQGLYKPGTATVTDTRLIEALERVAIAVDVRTNVLIISASKENFAVLEEIIKRVDGEDWGVLGDVRLYMLEHADATRLAPVLQQFFTVKRSAEEAAGSSGRSLPVSIIPDARTNTLLVAGSRESFTVVEEMIKKLDHKEVLPATLFSVFELKQATAAVLRDTLERLFNARVVRGQTRDPVTIIADTRTNSLIIGAAEEDMKIAQSLISRLDKAPAEPGKTLQIFPLEKADATQVADTLRSLYRAQTGAPDPGVVISVDERINAIVVSAGAADIERISSLIDQLDRKEVTRVTEIKVFPLKNADATELATLLTAQLTQKPAALTAVSPNRQTLLQFIATTPDGKELVERALKEGVLITPDRRTNSLVVSAPMENIQFLSRLIEALDSITPPMAEIRIFTLVNSDAAQMADILTALFRLQAGAPSTNARSVRYTLVTTQPAGEGATADVGTAKDYALSVTVDPRTNSLLVSGMKRYVELASSVIKELDSSPAQERMTKVYRLRNARATDVQGALSSFLDQERQRLTSTLGNNRMGAMQRMLEQEIAVVAVPADGSQENASTLLLSASPRYFKTLQSMIEELDQPPPQVLIQVLLAAIRLDDAKDIGFEWNYIESENSKTYTYRTNFFAQAEITAGGGFNLTFSGGQFTFFLRALQNQGRLEVLSRPEILAHDNVQAEINIGQRVPIPTDTRITEGGDVISSITYENVGTILTVTPRINPDGFVRMDISPEISAISSSSVEISPGVAAPIIDRRVANTTVTVKDGHTIVLGGLITTSDDVRERKVPVLGDVPILGNLFKRTTVDKERTELLIVLTPHVIRNVTDADRLTKEHLDRMNAERKAAYDAMPDILIKATELLKTDINDDTRTKKAIIPEIREITPLEDLPKLREEPATRPVTQPARKKDAIETE